MHMDPIYVLTGAFLCSLWLIRLFFKRLSRRSIDYLLGPPPGSWLVGNFPDLSRPDELGDADFSWIKAYGSTLHIKHTFGEDRLFTADPKAIQYILNTSGYNFPKPPESRVGSEMLLGRGLVWAEGTQHARQRKIMNPAFSFAALRGFLPLFRQTSQRAVNKIKDDMFAGTESKVVDITKWLSRITLDAIGEAAFGYQFHAVTKGHGSKLAKAYDNLLPEAFADLSDASLATLSVMGWLPTFLIHALFRLPVGMFKPVHSYITIAREVAQDIVDKQTALYLDGKEGSKDVMMRANLSEDPKSKLSTEEILPQMTTLFLAGHDTTAITSSWALYHLSRNLEYQRLVREEIKATRAAAAERGDSELTIADLDSMKYLLATMKETLRYNPIVPSLVRKAGRDDVIPLALPVKSKTGETITSVPVSKGQTVHMSFIGYNRLSEVWGPDADQWCPERFLEGVQGSQKVNLGVISNVATFSSGLRGCIGWRFAVLEMQAILIELLESFEFSPSPDNIEIIMAAAGVMTPMIKGSKERRANLPLTMTLL
ncbi:hypothetical protein M422DRAFT_248894 [Sphaerobolus stellatus SS14]|nr:hypothetical protein M422DRAFT_248894 [Sphaerobolus stellatus SS14]